MPYFTAKIHEIRFRLEVRPRPYWGTYSALTDPLPGLGRLKMAGLNLADRKRTQGRKWQA